MSNFVVINVNAGGSAKVRTWLASHAAVDEAVCRDHEHGWSTWIIATEIDRCMDSGRFFRGTAITDAGVSYMKHPGETRAWGTFVAASPIPGGVRVSRDMFGMVQMFSTADAGFSAASDSLTVLASLRRALGAPLTVDAQNLRARSILDLTAAQSVGESTHFQEVTAHSAAIEVDLFFDSVVTRHGPLPATMTPGDDYVEATRDAARELARTIATVATVDGHTVEIAMSGGLDSRLVLAGAMAGGVRPKLRSSRSTRTHERDFEVAHAVARAMELPFEEIAVTMGSTDSQLLAAYGAFFAGVCDRIGGFRLESRPEPAISMNGSGIGAAKGPWGWQSWASLAEHVTRKDGHATPATRAAFTRAGQRALASSGFDADAEDASATYYALYRQGVHSSYGTIARGMTGMHVLAAPGIMRAGRTQPSANLPLDLTLLLAPELTVLEYDRPERGFTKAQAEKRLAELGGPIGSVEPLAVCGTPADLPIGPSKLGLSVARSLGFEGEQLRDVLGWFADDVQRLPRNLQRHYRKIFDNGKWMLGKANGHVPSAGPSIAKAAGLRVLAALD